MITRFSLSTCAALLAVLMPAAAAAQGARIQLDQLNHLADKAQKVVDVNVESSTLRQAAGFLSGKDTNSGKVRELIEGLTAIYVKGFEFKGPAAYSPTDIESIRKQVAGSGWSRAVSVRDQNELTEIYFWRERGENGGLVVVSAEPNGLTVVNIVGRIDLASLAALGPMIPKLSGATDAAPKK
jgi:hypothetical protein